MALFALVYEYMRVLFFLSFCVAALAPLLKAANVPEQVTATYETSEETKVREAKLPVTKLARVYLDNKDGTVTPAYSTSTEPRTVYVWKGIYIDPKKIPHLNELVSGSDFYPGSFPYSVWSTWDVKSIDPPKQYYWDEKAKGFRAVYRGPHNDFLYNAGKLYQKSDLPEEAEIIDLKVPFDFNETYPIPMTVRSIAR